MHAILLVIGGWLVSKGIPFIVKILAALGIGVLVYSGVDVAVGTLRTHLVSSFSGVPGDLAAIVSMSGFGVYLSLVVSAFVASVTVRTSLGAFSKIGFKGRS